MQNIKAALPKKGTGKGKGERIKPSGEGALGELERNALIQ